MAMLDGTSNVGPTDEPNDAINNVISGFFNDARARVQSQDFSTVFGDMLKTVQNQPAPAQLPVPPALHPVGQLAAVFASTLAEQLGARGSVAAQQQRAQQNFDQRQTAETTNILRKDEFERNKAKQELDIRIRINEARAEQAKQMGNLDEWEARLKAGGALRKEQIKQQEEAKLKAQEALQKDILARVLEGTKARGEEARKTLNYRVLLKKTMETAEGKASDPLKAWMKLQHDKIFSRDLTGEYIYTPEQQEKMAEESYTESLRRMAEEGATPTGTAAPAGDAFDNFINSLFTE